MSYRAFKRLLGDGLIRKVIVDRVDDHAHDLSRSPGDLSSHGIGQPATPGVDEVALVEEHRRKRRP